MRSLFSLLPLLVACSTVHGVRPLGKGGVAVEGSLGGPVTEVWGKPIPLPISTVGAAVGVTETTDVHAAWHSSAFAFFGLPGADVGVSQQLLAQKGARPRVMADLTLVGIGGDVADEGSEGGFRLFVQPTATAAWDWGKQGRHAVYGSLTSFVQPFPDVHALGAVAIGNQWGLGRVARVTTEVKWIQPWASSDPLAPEYVAPGRLGAVSANLGLGFVFGGGK